MPRLAAILATAGLSLWIALLDCQSAWAQSGRPGVELPYTAWQGEAAPPPDSPPVPAGPPPEIGRVRHARRPIEMVGQVGGMLPLCRRHLDAACPRPRPSVHAGLLVLWRARPRFAWGAQIDATRLGARSRRGPRPGGVSFYGVAGRVYAFDSGLVDPYLQLAIGGGFARRSSADSSGEAADEIAVGPVLRVGSGVDLQLSRHVRAGPVATFTNVHERAVLQCSRTACERIEDRSGRVSVHLSVTARLTILLGKPL